MAKTYDVIYLQSDGCTDEESEFYGTTTWCEDMINDTDIKYIRAEAAEARIAELERVLRMVEFGGEWELQWCHWCHKMSNINKDTNDLHAPDCPRQAVLNE